MAKSSPHLPPDSCTINTHYRLQSLWRVLFFVFIGCLSGVTAAFVAVAWIVPQVGSVVTVGSTFGPGSRTSSADTPDPLLVQQTEQRRMSIFDSRKKIEKTFFPETALVGEAMLLSSDGWAVVYDPDNTLPDPSFWEGIDHQGVSHKVVTWVKDAAERLVYAQFSGEGFRIVSFASFDTAEPDVSLWSLQGEQWQRVYGDTFVRQKQTEEFLLWQPQFSLRVLPTQPKKSILLSDQGELFGIVDANGTTVPAWRINAQLNSILKSGKISYDAVPWKGIAITRQTEESATRGMSGFYITSGAGRTGSTGVRNGDIVTALQGKPADITRVAYDLFLAPDEFVVTVLREGQEMNVTVKKVDVK